MRLILLSRAYCHLCDEMEAALRPLIGATPLDVIDVDAKGNGALELQYGEAVPVLFAGACQTGRELCRFRLDPDRVLAALAAESEIR